MFFERCGACLLGLTLLVGCKDCCCEKPRYSVTLYGGDGTPIRTWTCDDFQVYAGHVRLEDNGRYTRISGTSIIERIDK